MATNSTKKRSDLSEFTKLFGHGEPRISSGRIDFRVSDLDRSYQVAQRIIEANNLKIEIVSKNAQLRSFEVKVIEN